MPDDGLIEEVFPRPRVLDLCCGAGGMAKGLWLAGFDPIGVDIKPQPNYPFSFVHADALAYLDHLGDGIRRFDAVHASPPCQAYSTLNMGTHADLYETVRDALEATGLPWVIENVPGAPFRSGVTLCGSMFGLPVKRHRNFETSFLIMVPPFHSCPTGVMTVTGHTQKKRTAHSHKPGSVEEARAALGIDWNTTLYETVQAVPPAYGEFIGRALMDNVRKVAA
jgi:DNA (cytosine-5)-methyltransferase 1